MDQTATDELCSALHQDLTKVGPEGLENVVNDSIRRIFTARITGATMEFAHKQADRDFWTGVKYYGSGSSSRVRFRRTPVAEVVKVKAPRARRAPRVVAEASAA